MTLICPSSGPSQIIPGVAHNLVYAAGGAEILATAGAPAWLQAAAAVLGILYFDLTQICVTDPPAMPVFSADDLIALAVADPGSQGHVARQKVQDAVTAWLWNQSCQCVTGPQPPPPTAPSLPANAPVVFNPPPQTGAVCATHPYSVVNLSYFHNPLDFWSPALAVGAMTTVHCHIVNAIHTSPGQHMDLVIDFGHPGVSFGDGAWYVHNNPVLASPIAPGATLDFTLLVPPAANELRFSWQTMDNNAGTADITATFDAYCGGQAPGGPTVACCQPDDQTLSTLQQVLAVVNLIQRQHVPFSSIHGAAHTGLTGDGAITVAGILGVRVDVTTLPSRAGRTAGDPVTLYDMGWIIVGTADGFGPRQFIASDPFLLEPVAGDVTTIGYSIPADVVVTITELVREP